MQNTIAQHHHKREKITWNHQVPLRAQFEIHAATPETVAHASLLFFHDLWKQSFRAMLPWNSKSWRYDNKAFVRWFLEIPRVEDMKTNLRAMLPKNSNWTQWSLGYVFWAMFTVAHAKRIQWSLHCPSCGCQLDTMISGLCSPSANWTQWSLSYVHSSTCQLDTMISESELCSLRHMPTGHNDLWAMFTQSPANWTQWSLIYENHP